MESSSQLTFTLIFFRGVGFNQGSASIPPTRSRIHCIAESSGFQELERTLSEEDPRIQDLSGPQDSPGNSRLAPGNIQEQLKELWKRSKKDVMKPSDEMLYSLVNTKKMDFMHALIAGYITKGPSSMAMQ